MDAGQRNAASAKLAGQIARQISDMPPAQALAVVAGATCSLFYELGGHQALDTYANLISGVNEENQKQPAKPPTGKYWN